MINVEVVLNNGQKTKINFDGTVDEFKDVIKFDNGTSFFQDEQAYYILAKHIALFKFEGITNE
jgi:hypothetical protein